MRIGGDVSVLISVKVTGAFLRGRESCGWWANWHRGSMEMGTTLFCASLARSVWQ